MWSAFSKIFIGHDVFTRVAGELVTSLPLQQGANFLNPQFCTERARLKAKLRTTYPKWDLAILRLQEKLPDSIAAMALPTEPLGDQAVSYSHIYAAGYGRSDALNVPGKKHRARFIFKSRRCSAADAVAFGCTPDIENVSVAYKGGADSCFGDSGGPVFGRQSGDDPPIIAGLVNMASLGFQTEFDVPKLLAITSRGTILNRSGLCGKGAINTWVDHPDVTSWISSAVQFDYY